MEDSLQKTQKWGSALAVALSALGISEGTATAQTPPTTPVDEHRAADLRPVATVVLVPFAGARYQRDMARFGVPTTVSLHREDGIVAYRHDPGDPRCLWDGNYQVCIAQEDILQDASGSRRDAVGQALHDNGSLYRVGHLLRTTIRRLSGNTPLTPEDRTALHTQIRVTLESDGPVFRAACRDHGINDCLFPLRETAATEHFMRNLDELAERLDTARANVACASACQTQDDISYCQRHGLGRLSTVGWDHPANEADGGMARCTASPDDPLCARRPVLAVQRHTCESMRSFWNLVSTQAQTRRDRLEAADQAHELAVYQQEREEHLLPALLAAHNAPPPAPVLADRDGDTVADATDVCPDVPQGPSPDPAPARVGCPAPELQVAAPRARHHRRHRDRVTAVRPPSPAFDHEVEGMECTTPTTRGAQWMTTCVIRASNAASANFEARAIRADGMHATGGTLPTEYSRLAPRMARYSRVARTILTDNPGNTECASPIVLACRKTGWTRANPQYFRRRVGICAAANGNADPVTLESFVADAATECGTGFHVSVWGVTGGHVRLRFDRDPTVAPPDEPDTGNPLGEGQQGAQLFTPHPDNGTEVNDSRLASNNDNFTETDNANDPTASTNATPTMTTGTPRVLITTRAVVRRTSSTRIARTLPPQRLTALSSEVRAPRGTTTPWVAPAFRELAYRPRRWRSPEHAALA